MRIFLKSFARRQSIIFMILVSFYASLLNAQPVPSEEENIPYLVTFGNKAKTSWGDCNFKQIFFFLIPENYKKPFFIGIYDPYTGGAIDEANGDFDTQTSFSFYGGVSCWSAKDAQTEHPGGNYKSGKLLETKIFGNEPKYDMQWFYFGPFNPVEGEYVKKFGGYVFKMIAEGISGNDGNLYKYFLTSESNTNKPIEGANAFAYYYTFRLWDDPNQVSHIYPYIDDRTTSVIQSNFDWDDDGFIRFVSVAQKGKLEKVSGDDNWASSEFKISEEEKNTSLDIQIIKRKNPPVINNNVVIFVKNQYGELKAFYTIPIGGVPTYKYKIKVSKKEQ